MTKPIPGDGIKQNAPQHLNRINYQISEAGDWRPTASVKTLQLRARMLSRIRGFFAAHSVMEVETPALSRAAVTDPNLASFAVATARSQRYLHTSPEFPMKRLLAADSGDIYQICKVFRADEAGCHHNPEFSMLEWYRLDFDHLDLMDEVEELLQQVCKGLTNSKPIRRLAYRDAFIEHAGLDLVGATVADCATSANKHRIEVKADLALQQWRDLIMSHVIVPACAVDGLTFIYDFPADQAALARVRPDDPPVAERFELIGYGLELANGFHELTDPREQRERFERELQVRQARGLPCHPLDERLLETLSYGLPDCAGVALGLDRLVMLAGGLDQISEAMAFSWENA
jgi:lysyl-tRNA synthetase class 2